MTMAVSIYRHFIKSVTLYECQAFSPLDVLWLGVFDRCHKGSPRHLTLACGSHIVLSQSQGYTFWQPHSKAPVGPLLGRQVQRCPGVPSKRPCKDNATKAYKGLVSLSLSPTPWTCLISTQLSSCTQHQPRALTLPAEIIFQTVLSFNTTSTIPVGIRSLWVLNLR